MTQQGTPELAEEYWYGQPNVVDHWFHGVFAGGGAKGVAYAGALSAMSQRNCWFRAVAGASAGAVTAALIAAGFAPSEIEAMTDHALKHVRTGLWAGLWRLKTKTGYFPSTDLRNWLDDVLRQQISRKTKVRPDGLVTFRDLYAATQIELNVVAADLSMRCHVIFSCFETPDCAVADAVVASSSIPFAFPSRLLRVQRRHQTASYHTIVDGGVWSNFPMYVFEDEAFRRYYRRVPVAIDPKRILGFMLDQGDQESLRGDEIAFVGSGPVKDFHAKEWEAPTTPKRDVPSRGAKVGASLLFPFSLLGRLLDRNGGVERGRWPTPTPRWVKHLVESINGLLGGIHPTLFALLACAIVVIGGWTVANWLVGQQSRILAGMTTTGPLLSTRLFTLALNVLGAAVVVLVLFASILGVLANWVLLRTSRRILYGLVATYVAGSGAPLWAVKERQNIVALPIPPTVTTLSFEIEPAERAGVIASANQVTLARLLHLLPEERASII